MKTTTNTTTTTHELPNGHVWTFTEYGDDSLYSGQSNLHLFDRYEGDFDWSGFDQAEAEDFICNWEDQDLFEQN